MFKTVCQNRGIRQSKPWNIRAAKNSIMRDHLTSRRRQVSMQSFFVEEKYLQYMLGLYLADEHEAPVITVEPEPDHSNDEHKDREENDEGDHE